MTNTNNKKTMKKKLISAIAMLTVSAVTLSTATYAWFTMNKEVSVVGMQMKAHAEEGLLINEVALAGSPTWDEQAVAGDTGDYTALRPASTYNLTNWWHANSKKVSNEAGYGSGTVDATNTVQLSGGGYYTDISSATENHVRDGAAGTAAEKNIYYSDATFGSGTGTYDNGEGFYVKYTYYLKSSNSDALNVAQNKLEAKVSATRTDENGASGSTNLDSALRVGIMINDVATNYTIFAPVSGADSSYNVTNNTSGTEYTATDAWYMDYASTNGNYQPVNRGTAITIPNVNTDGIKVDVYVWFEGEDTNCKSENLTANLNEYEISINFRDADILV
jgi:hypothetical protein